MVSTDNKGELLHGQGNQSNKYEKWDDFRHMIERLTSDKISIEI